MMLLFMALFILKNNQLIFVLRSTSQKHFEKVFSTLINGCRRNATTDRRTLPRTDGQTDNLQT